MKLEKYISDLLYRYDLVIVPGFGGIIGRKKSAHIDRENYIFSPPYKELSFNANLTESDGLLVRYVAKIMKLSNEDALRYIEDEVKKWNETLRETKRLRLNQIGIINLTQENKRIFLPLTTRNYLPEAYGMSAFVHKPFKIVRQKEVVRNKTTKQPVKTKQKTFMHSELKVPAQKRDRSNLLKYAAAFVVGLGLVAGGVSYYYNTGKPQATYQKATFVLKENFPAVEIGNKNNVGVDNQNVANKDINVDNAYFIISGAFRNKANAQKKVQELINAGFTDAQIIGQNQGKLWMVAYQGFISNDDAHKKLSEIKATQKGAWVYKKH